MADLTASSPNPTLTFTDSDAADRSNDWRLRGNNGPLELQQSNILGTGWNGRLVFGAASGGPTLTLKGSTSDVTLSNPGSTLLLDGDLTLEGTTSDVTLSNTGSSFSLDGDLTVAASNPRLTLTHTSGDSIYLTADGTDLSFVKASTEILNVAANKLTVKGSTSSQVALERTSGAGHYIESAGGLLVFADDTNGTLFRATRSGSNTVIDTPGTTNGLQLSSAGTLTLESGNTTDVVVNADRHVEIHASTGSASTGEISMFAGSDAGIDLHLGNSGTRSFSVHDGSGVNPILEVNNNFSVDFYESGGNAAVSMDLASGTDARVSIGRAGRRGLLVLEDDSSNNKPGTLQLVDDQGNSVYITAWFSPGTPNVTEIWATRADPTATPSGGATESLLATLQF